MTEHTRILTALPSKAVQKGLLATAISGDLDKIAELLGYEPRRHDESDASLRTRCGG